MSSYPPDNEPDHVEGAVQMAAVLAYFAASGTKWTEAFLGSGNSGVRIAEAFLEGRKDYARRQLMDLVEAIKSNRTPFVVTPDVMNEYQELDARLRFVDDVQREAALLGRALDVVPGFTAEFYSWVRSHQTDDISVDLRELHERLPGGLFVDRATIEMNGYDLPPAGFRGFLPASFYKQSSESRDDPGQTL